MTSDCWPTSRTWFFAGSAPTFYKVGSFGHVKIGKNYRHEHIILKKYGHPHPSPFISIHPQSSSKPSFQVAGALCQRQVDGHRLRAKAGASGFRLRKRPKPCAFKHRLSKKNVGMKTLANARIQHLLYNSEITISYTPCFKQHQQFQKVALWWFLST